MLPRSDAARAAWAVFALTLPLYLATMNGTVGFIDRGELAAAAYTFGIPHATGYPTLMLVAGGLTHAVPLRPVLTLNILAALLVAAGAAMLVLMLERVLRSVVPHATEQPSTWTVAGWSAERTRVAFAAAGALFTALTMTWWQQANGFEVYALHALFMPLVVLLGIRWVEAGRDETNRTGIAFGLVTGLSFTNHMTTGLLAPGLIVFAFARLGAGAWKRIAQPAPWFLLGLLPYAWLPLRSAMQPRFDWGNPETLRGFLHHVGGGDYHNRLFSDGASVALQLRYLMWRVPWDYAWVGLVIAGLGALLLARRAPALAALAALCAGAGFAFAAGYRIPDIEAYVLTIVLGLSVCFTAGLAWLGQRNGPRPALALAAVLVLANGAIHWRDCDERGNGMAEAFVHDMLEPMPRDAVLISSAWDVGLSAAHYFQEVEGLRRDVVIMNPDLARVSWYLDELERRAPLLTARAGDAFERYRETLRGIEHGAAYRGASVEGLRQTFLAAFAAGAMRDRAVFTTDPLPAAPPEWRRVPYGIAKWLRADASYVEEPRRALAFRPWAGRLDCFAAMTCWGYGEARLARARYEAAHGRLAEARAIAAGIRAFDPHIRPENVGPLPLGTDATVLSAARFFRSLDGSIAASAER